MNFSISEARSLSLVGSTGTSISIDRVMSTFAALIGSTRYPLVSPIRQTASIPRFAERPSISPAAPTIPPPGFLTVESDTGSLQFQAEFRTIHRTQHTGIIYQVTNTEAAERINAPYFQLFGDHTILIRKEIMTFVRCTLMIPNKKDEVFS